MTVRRVEEVQRKLPLSATYELAPGGCYLVVVSANQVSTRDINALIHAFDKEGVFVTVLTTPGPPPDIRVFDMFTMKEKTS